MNRTYNRKAFTLVELIVATAILAVVMTSIVTVIVNFTRNYGKSESSGILLQESALFLARLRTDMNNAVVEGNVASIGKNGALIYVDSKQLRFPVYSSTSGRIEHVVYEIEQSRTGYSVTRKTANDNIQKIADNIATVTWKLENDVIPLKPKPIERYSLYLDMEFSLKKDNSGNSFKLKTRIFPARLNRQIN